MGFSFQIILVNKSRDEELPCIEDYLPVFEVPSAFLGSIIAFRDTEVEYVVWKRDYTSCFEAMGNESYPPAQPLLCDNFITFCISLTNLYPILKSKWLQNIEDRFNGDVVSSSVTPSGEIDRFEFEH